MRLENDVMTDGAWELLVMHKLGNVSVVPIISKHMSNVFRTTRRTSRPTWTS